MFEGSENHNTDFSESIEKFGGTDNGSTSEDRTNYWENIPSNYLEKILWLEADRMGNLLPAITQERLDNQRDVVKNERRYRVENQPYAKSYEILTDLMYPDNHPYSWSVLGSMEDLSAASLEDVKEFFRLYYAPNNASLSIAGDFDPAEVKKWVEKYFGPIPAGKPVDRIEEWIPKLNEIKRYAAEDAVSLPRLYMAWHTSPYLLAGDAEFDLFASILASGKTSRLYKTLVYEKQIAQDVSAYQSSKEIGSDFNVIVTAKEGYTLEEIEKEIDIILNDILTNGFTQEELDMAVTTWESSFVRGLERVGGFGGKADRLNRYNIYLGDPDMLKYDMERYTNATVGSVMEYAREYIDMNGRVILYVYPQGDLNAAEAVTDMTVTPNATSEPTFTPPQIQTATLSNGMELYLVEDHKLPLVQINLQIKSGWAADPVDRPGAAALTSQLLDEGTKSMDALQISDEVRRLGLNFGSNSGFDNSSVNMNTLKKNLDSALKLMADVVLNPTFPEKELERIRQNYLGRIQQESRRSFTVAYKAFNKQLFGDDHPYAQPYTGSGTEESINAITKSDLENFYKANYLPNNTAAIVVGDLTMDEAKSKLENAFKKWKSGDVTPVEIKNVPALESVKICLIDKPNAAQSAIVLGGPGLRRSDDDFTAATVMNNALGGQFTARINMNLREDKGFTYGAMSVISSRKGQGAFFAYSEVQTEVTKEAVVEFLKEFNDINGSRPLSDDELKFSKDNLIKGFPQDFQTYSGIAGQLGTIVSNGLPLSEWETYVSNVNSIDMNIAMTAAKNHVKTDELLIVVVGDLQKIEDSIKELNLGEIIYLNDVEI
jgi:zinc protease